MKCIHIDENSTCKTLPVWDIYEMRKFADVFLGRACRKHIGPMIKDDLSYHFKWINHKKAI